uniref:Uncharacterized protein n=1 Tax=Arundo donax TaxID=35708 RepID=A0A0A9GXG4_ARUDO
MPFDNLVSSGFWKASISATEQNIRILILLSVDADQDD